MTSVASACSPPAATPWRSPFSSDANGSVVFHSGCCGASALTRSTTNSSWKYAGCSDHSVPSLSKTAMRSAGATNDGEPAVVVFVTKSTMRGLRRARRSTTRARQPRVQSRRRRRRCGRRCRTGQRRGQHDAQADGQGGDSHALLHEGLLLWRRDGLQSIARAASRQSRGLSGTRSDRRRPAGTAGPPCACYCLLPAVTASITRSRLKLPGFWRGGYSLKDWSHLRDVAARRGDGEHVIEVPALVADGVLGLGPLERIHQQVGQRRRTQRREGLEPHVHALGFLFQEGDLPALVAERRDAAVVGPVDELLARPLGLATEGRTEVVAVEVHLVRAVADLQARQEALRAGRVASRREQRRQHVLVRADAVDDRARA